MNNIGTRITNSFNKVLYNHNLWSGLLLLLISSVAFIITDNQEDNSFDLFSGTFFLCYAIVLVYFIILAVSNKSDLGAYFKFGFFGGNVILLQLFNLSAYALNRSFSVFCISTDWLVWFLLISNICLTIFAIFYINAPKWFHYLFLFIGSIALVFHIYQSIYLMQGYGITILTFWFFGIPMHTLVPPLFVMAYIVGICKALQKVKLGWISIGIGLTVSLFLMVFFIAKYQAVNQAVQDGFHKSNEIGANQELPTWVEISKNLSDDWITKRILQTSIQYATIKNSFNPFDDGLNFDEVKHDPLLVIASFFGGDLELDDDHRIKILRSTFDERHKTERKLWSGHNLSTKDIVTNVELFPSYRLAYTEKTFRIHHGQSSFGRNTEEALYTFNLPEGAFITSSSLWINDREERAYLTTKSKADSAYTTIVGRENRDPMVVHWQEGNRVTVRVFPCTPEEDRTFKIGITSSLKYENGRLTYENIDFNGPFYKNARESIQIVCNEPLVAVESNIKVDENGKKYSGDYVSEWWTSFNAPKLSDNPFNFNGTQYQISDYQVNYESLLATNLYLDLNQSWHPGDINEIISVIGNRNIFVQNGNNLVKLTSQNKELLLEDGLNQQFNLFPFHKIKNPTKSVVITKYNRLTPTLNDIEQSKFLKNLSSFFEHQPKPIAVLSIGHETTPYLKTLRELRLIKLEEMAKNEVVGMLKNQKYCHNQENDSTIINANGNFKITRNNSKDINQNEAPDHLMRFFEYNDVLRQVGKNYFNKKQLESSLIKQTERAYVVTPISSLIVLESQADYDRFDIKQSENSLHNASIGNSGAVPEPHEWVLIIIVLLFTLRLYLRR